MKYPLDADEIVREVQKSNEHMTLGTQETMRLVILWMNGAYKDGTQNTYKDFWDRFGTEGKRELEYILGKCPTQFTEEFIKRWSNLCREAWRQGLEDGGKL